jgi:hypothetical protein
MGVAFLERNGFWVVSLIAVVVALYLPADAIQLLVDL